MEQERQHKITNLLETYFSDASLLWDKVMLSKILADPKGMVPIEALCKLPRLKAIQATPEEIKYCAEQHSQSKLQIDQEKIGRIKPYVVNKTEELDDWSIYVEGLEKPYNNEQAITQLFSSLVGHVSFFRIPPNQQGQANFLSYCFIEFDLQQNVEKAVQLFKQTVTPDHPPAKELKLRVMSKLEWNRYKDEYLHVLEERKAALKKLWEDYHQQYPEGQGDEAYHQEAQEEKGYEEGLVVFVDGLHPQCARTTATALLQTSGVEIAFMNTKKKGLQTVHVRLKNREDAQKLCAYFDQHPIMQETGQDTVGKEQASKTRDCLRLRILEGKKENDGLF
ncbi:hypothetical protein INT47_010514 [Mucor saturninus]|uniref:RRM domain-containing protein n=1 Tax=Mucor saturninus TaxID=64648 RepID=A0A8H7RDA5_9FUNG|nr:hypothetical protein INT47_010514 [Mucor saturninus]